MGNYIYEFDIAALVFLIIILWMLIHSRNMPTETNQYFKCLLFSAIAASAFDLFSIWVLETDRMAISLAMKYTAQILYLIPNMLCAVFYYCIACTMTRPFRKPSPFRRFFGLIACAVDCLFVATSPFTHLIFYINDEGEYAQGPLMPARYVLAFLIMFMALVDTIHYHRLMTKSQKRMSYGYTIACICALVLQSLVCPNVMLINFAISISAMLGFFALQSPADYTDDLTGLNNKHGFNHMVDTYFRQKGKFSLICIEYTGLDYVGQTLGESTAYEVIRKLSERLSTLVATTWLFRISHTRFVIMLPHRAENLSHIAEEVAKLGEEPVPVDGVAIKFKPIICSLHAPESMTYLDDVNDAISFGLSQAAKQEGTVCYNVEEDALIRKRRESAVLRVLKRAIANKEFEVAYQPVFQPEKNGYTHAEALARLNDKVLGPVSPSEFIPIAEKNGLIIPLGEIIIDIVCDFIRKNIDSGSRFNCISINLSPIQCMQTDFADRVIEIAERNGVPLSKLEFEVTSSTVEHAGENFIPSMERLSELGTRFTVDKYAVNITDTPRLTNVPFKTIKISHEMTRMVTSNDHMLPAMKNSIAAFKELGYRVVATGIETKDMADIFKGFGCDYLQGYYFSKPVSEADMAAIIKAE